MTNRSARAERPRRTRDHSVLATTTAATTLSNSQLAINSHGAVHLLRPMQNKILLLLLSLISVASLTVAIMARQETQAYANRPIANQNTDPIEEAQRQMRLIEAKLSSIANRLDSLESRPVAAPATVAPASNSSLDAVDANIETLLRTSAKNSQDVQKASQQVRDLAQQCNNAFNVVATKIQELRGDIDKLSGKTGTR